MAVVRIPDGVDPCVTTLDDGTRVVIHGGLVFDASDPVVKELKSKGWQFVGDDSGSAPKVRRSARVETADRGELR